MSDLQQRHESSWDGVVSARTSTALKSQNIRTFREVAAMNRRDLFKLPMIGKLAMREIDKALHERGFSYADGPAMIPTELYNPDKPKRGRPATGEAMTNAERQAKHRATEKERLERMLMLAYRLGRVDWATPERSLDDLKHQVVDLIDAQYPETDR